MKLQRLAKDGASEQGGCPALYLAEDGTHFVAQVRVLDADTADELQEVLPGETAGFIPIETVLRAVDRYRTEHGQEG